MKPNLRNLVRRQSHRFDGSQAAAHAIARRAHDKAGLKPEDGYDWLHRIKQLQAAGR